MEKAIRRLDKQWGGRRTPKAFYLNRADWAEFIAANPPTVRVLWGNNPPIWRDDPSFKGVPVRETDSASSRLYNSSGGGNAV